MTEYYFLSDKFSPGTAFAYTEQETPLAHELIPALRKMTEVPFELILRKVTISKDGLQVSDDISGLKYLWLDYQPNNLAWPLMSERLKNLVDSNLTGKEAIQWMKVVVKSERERRNYFIARFTIMLDVIDEQKTIFVPETSHIIKPVFSLAKVANYNLFTKPQEFWEIPSALYVSEKIKKRIEEAKLSGIGFERVSVV